MKWIKKGLVFCPNKFCPWMQTHAALPIADRMRGDLYRIYFATRDSENRSRIAYIDVDLKNPQEILQVAKQPVLDLGPLGSFDHYGVLPASIVNFRSKKYLYYTGWDRGVECYKFFIGLAISEDGGSTFKKVSDVPLLDRSREDPYLCASPQVILDNQTWRMWYSSGLSWGRRDGRVTPRYLIKYAESREGTTWTRNNDVCIGFKSSDEWAIARPSVTKDRGTYKMHYCYNVGQTGYRIGYAESKDCVRWERMDDQAGIDISDSGWDSGMVCYPFVFTHEGAMYMLYNGNEFGKTGFGYAVEQNGNE